MRKKTGGGWCDRCGAEKYAGELGLAVKKGVAYGEYRGYMVSLCEGGGWKAAAIGVAISDENVLKALRLAFWSNKFGDKYKTEHVNVERDMVEVVFVDTVGTMRRVKAALEEVLDTLVREQVAGAACCSRCGRPVGADRCVVKRDRYACVMHEGCVRVCEETAQALREGERGRGSAAGGVLGAVLGAAVGAVPWAIAYYFGWFVGWLGLVIGAAAKKGYELLHGPENRVKAVVVAVVTMLMVVAAEYATVLLSCLGELPGVPVGEVVRLVNDTIAHDGSVRASLLADVALGWLFAGLGIASTVREMLAGKAPAGLQRLE